MDETGTSHIPASGYKFQSMQEIKSHSSILYNERMAIWFYMLDSRSIEMNTNYRVEDVIGVKAILKQIYKNMRMLIRYNPVARATLNLETKDPGVYITDVALGVVDGMVEYCEANGYTTKRLYIIARELDKFEMMIKDILQYYNYFIRPDFRQKPDIDMATESYMEIADKRTVDELRAIVGKRNKIEFDQLGSKRIEIKEEEEPDDDEVYSDEHDYIDSVNEKNDSAHFDDQEGRE
jgi:hypothetical protein